MSNKPSYAMSRVGGCPRALGALRLGYKPLPAPRFLEEAAKEGVRHEQWIKEDMRAEGFVLQDGGPCRICTGRSGFVPSGIHVELEYELFKLTGHMDSRLLALRGGIPLARHRPLEIKALSRFRTQKFVEQGIVAFEEYACQITCYMEAEGHEHWPAMYVVKNRDTGRRNELDIPEPPVDIDEIVDKITLVEGNARSKRLATCDCAAWDRLSCGFNYLCGGSDIDVTRHVDDEEVKEAIRLYKEWDFSTLVVNQAKDVIKAWMIERDVRDIDIDGVVGKLRPMGRTSYPKSRLKEVGGLDDYALARCATYTSYNALSLAVRDRPDSN